MSIKRINLKNFRNYETISIKFYSPFVIFYGKNGSGKTNILESLSIFSLGNGFRNALIDTLQKFQTSDPWAAFIEIENKNFNHSIGIERGIRSKKIKIDGKFSQISKCIDMIKIIYFTPGMDQILCDESANRKKFLNKLVANFDNGYVENLLNYEKLIKERMKILQSTSEYSDNQIDKWITIIEKQICEILIKIELERFKFIENLNQTLKELKEELLIEINVNLIQKNNEYFEKIIPNDSKNINFEDERINFILESFNKNRNIDKFSKKTNFGCHRVDFEVNAYGINGKNCSSGQQKIIILSIIISVVKMYILKFPNKSVILLLDEINAHIDDFHKMVFFKTIKNIYEKNMCYAENNLQIFMTGTDEKMFEPIVQILKDVQILNINNIFDI